MPVKTVAITLVVACLVLTPYILMHRHILELEEYGKEVTLDLMMVTAKLEVYAKVCGQPKYFDWAYKYGDSKWRRVVLRISNDENNVCLKCHKEVVK